jgi:hypothetical protein
MSVDLQCNDIIRKIANKTHTRRKDACMKAIDNACNRYFQTWSAVNATNIPNPDRMEIFCDSVSEWLDEVETKNHGVYELIMKAREIIDKWPTGDHEYHHVPKAPSTGLHDEFDTTQYGKSKLEVLLSKLEELD